MDIPVSVIRIFMFLFFLLLLSAFFSSAETAITSSGRGKLLALQERHPYQRRFLQWLVGDVQRALTITLVSNNLVNIAASAVATSLAILLFGHKSVFWAVIIMTIVIVVFGEILPKSIAIVRSEPILIITLPILRFLGFLFAPFIWTMNQFVRFLGILVGVDLKAQHTFVTREEIEQMVNIGEASGALEAVERKMIHGIISFEETRVYEIMIPRTDMNAIASDATIRDSVTIFQEHGHSRVPVYDESLDDIVGILYVKDTIPYLASGDVEVVVSKLQREALFVPETMRIVEVFNIMKIRHVHMAIVVDEYGGTAGLVTLEDLLEEIVGEIQDEYDSETSPVLSETAGNYLVQGNVSLEDLSEIIGDTFESEDAESVAGLVLSLSGGFPEKGTIFQYGKWEIEVLDVEDHRIKLLRFHEVLRDEENEE
ncbi:MULTISPECIES: hemolysin family protein [Aminobacterium]|uniref:hemolysin family protein n=1 Tax=Aminobacterium TaxID=81466 RepID=UPI002580B394|nr:MULTISPECIES: hemolysin family protein [unclassified Aminobacterium]